MARSRNIKPGFFTNELLAELPFETRLLFVGLPCFADREGRLEDRPKRIKMAMFPADNLDVDAMLEELHQLGFIERYQVEDNHYIQIVNFSKHQKPHAKETASVIPCNSLGSGEQQPKQERAALVTDSLNTDSLKEQEQPRKRGDGSARKRFFDFAEQHDATEEANDYEAVLKKKKAANSERAWTDRLKTLVDLHARGSPPKAVIAKSANSGWAGLFEVKNGTATRSQPRETALQRSQRIANEELAKLGY